jgi:hypothetical protein
LKIMEVEELKNYSNALKYIPTVILPVVMTSELTTWSEKRTKCRKKKEKALRSI